MLVSQHINRIGQAALELVYPTRCIGCEHPGVLLCPSCEQSLPLIEQQHACPRCGAPFGSIICTECYTHDGPVPFAFSRAVCAAVFLGAAARIIVGYKDHGERRLAAMMAYYIAAALPDDWHNWTDAIAYIPADPKALRRRGFDHMHDVARILAHGLDCSLLQVLQKQGGADQRALNRAERSTNANSVFSAHAVPAGSRILLIDDVFTTGATLDAASTALLQAGAAEIRTAAFARVW